MIFRAALSSWKTSPVTPEKIYQALAALGLAMIERSGNCLSLIGKSHPADHETFAALLNLVVMQRRLHYLRS